MRRLLLTFTLAAISLPLRAQQPPTHPKPFPYVLDNFIWWSDADLRADLKHRIPTLRDEIVPYSPLDRQVRLVLIDLLKSKGIVAEVQNFEPTDPSTSTSKQIAPPGTQNPALLAHIARQMHPRSQPSIEYIVASPPQIQVGKVTIQGAPPDLLDALDGLVKNDVGTLYHFGHLANDFQLSPLFDNAGYFTATHTLIPEPYQKTDATHYIVPLTLVIDPGPQFHVGSIAVDAGPLFQGMNLLANVPGHTGDAIDPHRFNQFAQSLQDAYLNAGYPDAYVDEDPILDKEHALASYNLKVYPGDLVHFHSLTVKNLDTTREQIVRDMLDVHPGDVFVLTKFFVLFTKINTHPRFADLTFKFSSLQSPATHTADVTLDFTKK